MAADHSTGPKRCTRCKAEHPPSEFPSGHAWCNPCRRVDAKIRWANNREVYREKRRLHYAENKAKISQQAKARRASNPAIRERAKAYVEKNRERYRAHNRRWAEENPERRAEINRKYSAKFYKSEAGRQEWLAKYRKNAQNPEWRLRRRVHVALWRALRDKKGGGRWFGLLGYTTHELFAHIERQFTKGMSWENMGEWHIDHIIPLSSFTITGPDDPELRRAWALSNLRPLWAAENMSKSAKVLTLL